MIVKLLKKIIKIIKKIKSKINKRGFDILLKSIKYIKNWPIYILDSLFLTKENYIYQFNMRNGMKYLFRARTFDRAVIREIHLEDEYRLNYFILPDHSIIIDIGAHIGIFSIYCSKMSKKIYAYEPVTSNYYLLKKNINLNSLGAKIIPLDSAISDEQENLRIFLSNENMATHSIFKKSKDYMDFKAITLEDVIIENKIHKCDLLKIDTEGAEYKILFGLPNKYFERIERIFLEYHDFTENHQHGEIIELLKKKGYNTFSLEIDDLCGIIYSVKK